MKILASDTSTRSLSVAISSDEGILFSETIENGSVHSVDHMPLIEEALRSTGLDYQDIDLFACTVGPGSYTGIRINVSTLKALAYASDKGVAGVSTLKALEYPFRSESILVCPVLDARNRRVFSSVSVNGKAMSNEGNYSLDQLYEHLISAFYMIADERNRANLPSKVVFCGDAALKLKNDEAFNDVKRRILKFVRNVEYEFVDSVPLAKDVALIARDMYDCGSCFDPFRLSAEYISPSQAERMRKAKDDIIRIRAADENDLDRIDEIENESFTLPWSRESLKADITDNVNSRYIVAEIDGQIAGYAGYHVVFEQAQITTLAVSTHVRRRGTGRALVQFICDSCKISGCSELFLEVRAGNKSALHLYISEGFKVLDLRKGYYENDGESAIIMLKDL
ncbi:MAG: ribosomal protein S18-alanine N-acetyltransferase [Eubacteriales bacterium]|nr:ribosomal protein S18-alanine N-acetyltransferase [Eubacteriales bacterium]